MLDRHGAAVRQIVQLRAWPSSAVLRVHATDGDYYFKAVAYSIRRECAVTAYLAEHFAHVVPPLLAVDAERRWLLMHAADGCTLEEIASVAVWEECARRYGRLQMATRDHTGALRACGAGARDVEHLGARLTQLADADPEFRRLLPRFESHCAALAAYDIPSLLEHGDLWPGNFLVAGTRSVVIDWEDVAVGHPFFSLAPLLVGLQIYQPSLVSPVTTERIVAAYLEPFADLDTPSRLRAAVDLALPLAFCDMALRYQQQPPSVVRLHPWMRDLVPEALRNAIVAAERIGHR
jgi:aminoglycoside phosphotransferase (APT) family kinase protein